MKKVLLLTITLALITSLGFSQADRFWSANNESQSNIATDKAVARLSYPKEFKLFNLNAIALRQELFTVVGINRMKTSTLISLPNADGNLEAFEVFEASNFEPDLQAKFPEIRAYSGKGITDKYATLKLSISPQGIQTMVFRTETENEFMEPYSADHTVYSVYRSHRNNGELPWNCTTDEKQLATSINKQISPELYAAGSSTGVLKTMRLAQSCNGEYANYFGATSATQVDLVLAAYNATLTRCNGVFEKDLALHLNLIDNTTSVIYYNPSTDPYSTTLSQWNLQLQQTLTSVIGSANYDIGHMFGKSGGGGNAGCIGCVCVNPATSNSLAKGSGITSPADGIPMGNNFDIDYVVHEMGHQLGANHTFSMSLESGTNSNKEVGSGITIMGYAGITAQDVAPHSIDIFHENSIAQIQANLAGKTCPVSTNITANNVAPVIATVNNYTIPISTPFALTGSATDANADALTYCWEQNDNSTTSGTNSVASPTKTTGPNWLSFSPTISGTRLFPKLSTILAGGMVTGPLPGGDAGANIEALSSVSRTLNFRLTVRDNHVFNSSAPMAIGQTAFTDVVVTVTNTAGPFAVTSPNTNITWNAGSNVAVTWNVNGTNAGTVNCANVNILLSTDGGQTFPITLASSVPNNGSAIVTVPATPGTTNRIKVESVGNIFFDISNTNFTISGAAACSAPTGLTSSSITQTSATISWTAASGALSYDVDYKTASSGTWIPAATATASTSVNVSGLTSATLYDWRVRTNCSSSSSSYAQAQFTTASAPTCSATTGLTTSAITTSSATLGWSSLSGDANYDVDYKEASSGTWINAATATPSTSVGIAGLTASTLYDWRVRTNCINSLTSSYSPAQFTTNAEGAVCPGAFDVSTNGTTAGAAVIPLNTDVFGLIEVRGDNDYYKFTITTGGTITVSLSTLPADYQLALLNSAGSVMQSSLNNGTADETISGTATAGNYYVRVYPKNNGAWNAVSCYTLRVQTGTATRETIAANKFTVSPNPAGFFVNLAINSENSGIAQVSVISQTGASVLSKTLTLNKGENSRKLDIGQLANGMYFVKIQTGSVTQMAKLVVGK
ncbi:MAG: reprolysin-like metallopeptidase [Ferruginibacter sp.]